MLTTKVIIIWHSHVLQLKINTPRSVINENNFLIIIILHIDVCELVYTILHAWKQNIITDLVIYYVFFFNNNLCSFKVTCAMVDYFPFNNNMFTIHIL